jgi:transposase InsO family protein
MVFQTTDNGPQFTVQEFEKYIERHQIKHVKTPLYHPQSNRQAKNFVKTFKQALKKSHGSDKCVSY